MEKLEIDFSTDHMDFIDQANDELYESLIQLADMYNSENHNFQQKEMIFDIINHLEEVRHLLFQFRNQYYKNSC